MKQLMQVMRKRLAEKFLGKQMIGAIAQQAVYKLLPDYAKGMEVCVKHTKVYIKSTQHRDKIILYKEKNHIIQAINTALEKIGYTQKVTDIFFK